MLRTLLHLALLLCAVSGYPFTEPPNDTRIVGGVVTDIKKVPYQALIGGYCGGVIINKNWILTAAHCVHNGKEVKVIVGISTWPTDATKIPTEGAIRHPDFKMSNFNADVALLKLKATLTFSESIQPVKLIDVGVETPAGTTALVSGFGYTTPEMKNGTIREEITSLTRRDLLRSIEVPVIDHKRCVELYKDFTHKVLETNICAGLVEGGKDACKGDSGGPIIRQDTKELIGTVSWGRGCARPKYPGVYAKIAEPSIRNWIKKITGV